MTERSASPVPVIRALSRKVAEATDPQLMRIVATVDELAERGLADNLIAPYRLRLRQLRPARPLRFARLLFHPLDLLVVPAPRWRAAHCTIPRSAIRPMTDVVRSGMGAKAGVILTALQGHTADNTPLITALGATVWQEAGAILVRSTVPSSWAGTGLDQAAYHSLTRKIGAVLTKAPVLDTLCVETAAGLVMPDRDAIIRLVAAVSDRAVEALPMIIAMLLRRLPQAADALRTTEAARVAPSIKRATEHATVLLLDHLLREDGAQATLARTRLADAAKAASDMVALLAALDRDDVPAARRQQIRGARLHLDQCCRNRFRAGLMSDLLAPIRALPAVPEPGDVTALEDAARALRALETEARAIGSGPAYDRMLADATETVKTPPKATGLDAGGPEAGGPESGGLDRVDRLRLVELLSGPKAALALMRQP